MGAKATHVGWARDQLIALGAGSLPRCGSLSGARLLGTFLLRHEVGARWVMAVTKVVSMGVQVAPAPKRRKKGPAANMKHEEWVRQWNQRRESRRWWCWNVCVSATLGVVQVWGTEVPGAGKLCLGVSGRGRSVVAYDERESCVFDLLNNRAIRSLPIGTLSFSCDFCTGGNWAALHDKHTIVLWPAAVQVIPGLMRMIVIPAVSVQWMDILCENEAALYVTEWKADSRSYHREVWRVDLAGTYESQQLIVTDSYVLDFACKLARMAILFKSDTLIVAPYDENRKWKDYHLETLHNHTELRACDSEPFKVDSRHFMEVGTSLHHRELNLYSTDDFDHPCRIFQLNPHTRFQCGCGCVVLWDYSDDGEHLDLCDAETGAWLLRLPLEPPPSFTLTHESLFLTSS